MEQNIGRLISILYRKGQAYLNVVLEPFGITASELPILLCLYKGCGKTQEEICAYSCIDKAAIARAVQSLADKGWLRKEKDSSDKRANKIYLEQQALAQEKQIKCLLSSWTGHLTAGLEQDKVAVMYNVLEDMVKKFT